jgi:uncharacterized protein YwqG
MREKLHDLLGPFGVPAWRPVFAADAEILPTDSSFAGVPFLGPGDEWPACPSCDEPYALLVQLNVATLPEAMQTRLDLRNGYVQWFILGCDCYDGYIEDEDTNCVLRWLPDTGPAQPVTPVAISDTIGSQVPLKIVRWEDLGVDCPTDSQDIERTFRVRGDEIPRELLDILGDDDCATITGQKLGGYGRWGTNELDYPECPRCRRLMQVMVFQIDSEGRGPITLGFGDGDSVYLFQCKEHRDQFGVIECH